ncbi:MAG: DMT family transporter [Clostridiales Family XIII bacterium]|nr:DMT family transporter [Clostridiales Family XIII bacterium]
MKKETRAVLMLLVAGFCWSLGGVLVKTTDAHPLVIASFRSLFGAVVFFVALKGRPRLTFSKPQVIGAVGYAATLICFVSSTKMTSAANAILLQYISPIIVAVLAYFVLHERLHWYDFASIAGMLIGLWLIMRGQLDSRSMVGNLVAICGGIGFALVPICLRLQKDGSPYETIFLGNILTFLAGLPLLFIDPPSLAFLPPVAFLGIVQLGLPYVVYVAASKNASAVAVSVLPSIEAVLNPIWVFLITHENPGLGTLIGGAVVLGVITFRAVASIRDTSPQ